MLKPSIYEKSIPSKNKNYVSVYSKIKTNTNNNTNTSNPKDLSTSKVNTNINSNNKNKAKNFSVITTQRLISNISRNEPANKSNLSAFKSSKASDFNKGSVEKKEKNDKYITNKKNYAGVNVSSRAFYNKSNNNSKERLDTRNITVKGIEKDKCTEKDKNLKINNLAGSQLAFTKNMGFLNNQDAKFNIISQLTTNENIEIIDNTKKPRSISKMDSESKVKVIKNELLGQGQISGQTKVQTKHIKHKSENYTNNYSNINFQVPQDKPKTKLIKPFNYDLENSILDQLNTSKGTNTSISININNFNQKNYHNNKSKANLSLINKNLVDLENVDCPEQQHYFNVALSKKNKYLARQFENLEIGDEELITLS